MVGLVLGVFAVVVPDFGISFVLLLGVDVFDALGVHQLRVRLQPSAIPFSHLFRLLRFRILLILLNTRHTISIDDLSLRLLEPRSPLSLRHKLLISGLVSRLLGFQ